MSKKIELTQNNVAIVDNEDFDWLMQYKWYLNKRGYVAHDSRTYGRLLMHRIIMQCPKDMQIDHINHEKLDNRKANLRIVTHQKNAFNMIKPRSFKGQKTSSVYKGVYWNKRDKVWQAYIKFNAKRKHLGCFKEESTAAYAYNEKALELFGEYALLNECN